MHSNALPLTYVQLLHGSLTLMAQQTLIDSRRRIHTLIPFCTPPKAPLLEVHGEQGMPGAGCSRLPQAGAHYEPHPPPRQLAAAGKNSVRETGRGSECI